MTMTRAFRQFVCRLMLGALVFGQMAIAAYACPALSGAPQSLPTMAMNASVAAMPSDDVSASMAMSADVAATPDMASCDQIDDSAANLCVEHCRFGQHSADHASTPTVSAALLTAIYTLPVQPEPHGHGLPPANSKFQHVAASPPHAILHCCFRI